MKVNSIVLCDYAYVGKDNKFYIVGIFDCFEAMSLPRFFLFAIMTGVDLDSIVKVKILLNGKEIKMKENMSGEYLLNILQGHSFSFLIEGTYFEFPTLGNYEFCIYHKDKKIGSTILEIKNSEEGK